MTESRVPLASLTTMRVGGEADELLVAGSRDELIDHALRLWGEGEPWLLLGGGSNTIVHDDGYPGTVLLVRNEGFEVIDDAFLPDHIVRVRVQAGQDWDSLVSIAISRGWGGIESLSGIPGLAGAAPIQNIGAYGTELADVLHSIEFLDESSGEVRRIPAPELGLAYRDSAMKRGDLTGVVLSIDLLLTRAIDGDEALSAPVRYRELANALQCEIGDRVSARRVREEVLRLRMNKGMVLDATDHDTWSSGSFFTNPIVSERFARSLPEDAPRFPLDTVAEQAVVIPLDQAHLVDSLEPRETPERLVKLSAAWLIERAGITKGFRLPGSGAAISSKHTLAITNRGAASAEDVAGLARYVASLVRSEFGVRLIPEPNLYGLDF